MRIATWSVNGVNKRLGYLRHWLRSREPDVVALQKIRIPYRRREIFPRMELERAGYYTETLFADHELGSVAILVRRNLLKTRFEAKVRQRGLPGREKEGRFLTVEIGQVRVSSVYVPYGPCGYRTKDETRRSIQSKVNWLQCLSKCVGGRRDATKASFLCGDFNVAPDGGSVPDRLNRSPEERGALSALCATGFVDLYRDHHGDGRPGFNSGTPTTKAPDTRLHLILGPEGVAPHVTRASVDLKYRGPLEDLPGEGWAPCAPVVINIADNVI